MKLTLCLTLSLVALAIAKQVKYDNYKVFRITPQTEEERQILLNLEENNPGVIFWKHVRNVGLPCDIMTPPHLEALMEPLIERGMNVKEMVDDVQSLINVEARAAPDQGFGWNAYYSTAQIHAWLDQMVAAHPSVATTGSYGQSFQGREMKYIRLNKGNTRKPIIWIDANIHAREWITNAVCTYIINDLLTGASNSWLDTYNFVIIPVLNPDGYEYSQSSDRMWRKTRTNYAPGSTCLGADPNRNFATDWGTGGSSTNPCSETYMGVRALSEPEVSSTATFIDTIKDDLACYLSLHSYSQLILISYGSNRGRIPEHARHMTVGNRAATAIRTRYGTAFTPGNIVELLYVASGGSGDHVKYLYNPNLAYTFELRDTGRYGFILPPSEIMPSCLEFMDGLNVILGDLGVQHDKA